MREALALIRSAWLTATSYRLATVFSLGGMIFTLVPLYFITGALQPVMADSIRSQGGEYFGFLLIGLVAFTVLSAAVTSLPAAIQSGISTGTLEALLATRAPLPALLAGLTGYSFVWSMVRALLMVLVGMVLGAHFAWGSSLLALAVLVLLIVAYLPFGLLGAAMVLAFRTTGPLPRGVLMVSSLLGGVYFPTQVIPSWIETVSDFVPLTYGLRALRRAFLKGEDVGQIAGDLAILAAIAGVLLLASLLAFAWALRHARRTGSLAQY